MKYFDMEFVAQFVEKNRDGLLRVYLNLLEDRGYCRELYYVDPLAKTEDDDEFEGIICPARSVWATPIIEVEWSKNPRHLEVIPAWDWKKERDDFFKSKGVVE